MAHCEIQLLTLQVPLEVRHLAIAVRTTTTSSVEGYPCLLPSGPLPGATAFHVPGFSIEVHLADRLPAQDTDAGVTAIVLPEEEVKKCYAVRKQPERQSDVAWNLQRQPPIIPCVRWSMAPPEFQVGDPVSFAQELNTLVA
jgi:hypothetical protein